MGYFVCFVIDVSQCLDQCWAIGRLPNICQMNEWMNDYMYMFIAGDYSSPFLVFLTFCKQKHELPSFWTIFLRCLYFEQPWKTGGVSFHSNGQLDLIFRIIKRIFSSRGKDQAGLVFSVKESVPGHRYLMLVILATQETGWNGSKCSPWVQTPTPKKKKKKKRMIWGYVKIQISRLRPQSIWFNRSRNRSSDFPF
jgi:hypothetical protein